MTGALGTASKYPIYIYNNGDLDRAKATIHMAHANGFPPQVYTEVLAPFIDDYHVVCLPSRPLWDPPPAPETLHSWQVMADDLIAGLEDHHLDPVIGIGHSMGGVATLMASLKRPELFSMMILLDPVLFPRRIVWLLAAGPDWLPRPQLPLVKKALRRRRQWESKAAAFERFRNRSLFRRWSDAALHAYIEGLTRPLSEDSQTIALRYAPEWEARIYETAAPSIRGWWRWISDITVPTIVLWGAETDTFTSLSAQLWTQVRPDIPVKPIAAAGHLFPMEKPQRTADQIEQFFASKAIEQERH